MTGKAIVGMRWQESQGGGRADKADLSTQGLTGTEARRTEMGRGQPREEEARKAP